jgi:hypothetical protein
MQLGYSHEIVFPIPENVTVTCPDTLWYTVSVEGWVLVTFTFIPESTCAIIRELGLFNGLNSVIGVAKSKLFTRLTLFITPIKLLIWICL